MTMATQQNQRSVTFRLSVGDNKLQKVRVNIYDKHSDFPIKTIECNSRLRSGSWKSEEVTLPKTDLFYSYLLEQSVTRLLVISSTKKIKEPTVRSLPPSIEVCYDVLKCPEMLLKPASVDSAILNYLQALNGSIGGRTHVNLQNKLCELEHMWQGCDSGWTYNCRYVLQSWTEKCISLYCTRRHNVIFLSVVYGKLAECYRDVHLRNTKNIIQSVKKTMLTFLENTTEDDVTTWSLSGLRTTALQVLECIGKDHWLYVAAYFPQLFDLTKQKELRMSMGNTVIDVRDAENIIIPKLQNNYKTEDVEKMLRELPEAGKTRSDKAKLKDLVDMRIGTGDIFLPPEEANERGQGTYEEYSCGSTSASNVIGAEKSKPTRAIAVTATECHQFPSVPVLKKSYSNAVKMENSSVTSSSTQLPITDTTMHTSIDTSENSSAKFAPQKEPSDKGVISFEVLICDQYVIDARIMVWQGKKAKVDTVAMNVQVVHQKYFKSKWVLATTEICLPHGIEVNYKFGVTWKLFWLVSLRGSGDVVEKYYRTVSSPNKVRRVFNDPTDVNFLKAREESFQAAFLFVEMLLPHVTCSSLKGFLIQVEDTGFPSGLGGQQLIDTVTQWIDKTVLQQSATECLTSQSKVVFLAVLLGKLLVAKYYVKTKCLSKQAISHMIHALQMSKLNEFPGSVVEDLETVCLWLVKVSNQSWLYVWQYFHELFDIETLVKLKMSIGSLNWTYKSWSTDIVLLQNTIDQLADNKTSISQLIICSLDECVDTRVLKEIMDLYYATLHTDENDNVINKAVSKLDDMIKKKWTEDLKMLQDILKIMRSTNTQLGDVVRLHIINYLKKEIWQTQNIDAIVTAITDSNLFHTVKELMEVIRNMLKQSDNFNIHHNFINVIKCQNILGSSTKENIQEILEMGIQSLLPSCQTIRKRDTALRMIYKILGATRDCEHLSCYESLKNQMDTLVYKRIKNISLEIFFRLLCPRTENQPDLSSTELQIMASHIQQRLCEDKLMSTERTNHIKQLKNSSGKLVIASQPMCDVLLAMITIQESLMPARQVLQSGDTLVKLEALVTQLLRESDFWIMIFLSEGEYSTAVKQHVHCNSVSNALQLFSKHMLDENITIGFARELQSNRALPQLLEAVFSEIPDSFNWTNCLQRVHEIYTRFTTRVLCLSDLFNNCVNHLSQTVTITDSRLLIEHLKQLQQPEKYRVLTLKDTLEHACWGPLFPMISVAEEINPCVHSTIFLNMCRYVTEGTFPSILQDTHIYEVRKPEHVNSESRTNEMLNDEKDNVSDEEEDDIEVEHRDNECNEIDLESSGIYENETKQRALAFILNKESIDTQAFATVILEICLPIFRQHCELLLRGDLGLSARVVEIMMDGVSSIESLQIELKHIKTIFGKSVPKEMVMALTNLVNLPNLTERSQQLGSMFSTFEVEIDTGDILQSSFLQLVDLKSNHTLTVQQLNDSLKTVVKIEEQFNRDDWDIIEQLAYSKELVSFLRPLVDEDLRNLIDAVEERSEQHVSESTVSDMIDVKLYLEPLLKVQPPHQAQQLIEAIKKNQDIANKVKRIPTKISSCVSNVHSLRDLYNNVANRGEMTKEIIRNALHQGVYSFIMDNKSEDCNLLLTYKQENSEAMYGVSQLNDYRSRALLIVNTSKHVTDTQSEEGLTDYTGLPAPDYETFISCVTTANDIRYLCIWLRESGHFSFKSFKEKVHKLEELELLKTGLQRTFDHWQAILQEAREKFYFLNFFYSKQLWQLDQFFRSERKVSEDLILLFRFVNTEIKADELEGFRNLYTLREDKLDLKARLFNIGIVLENIFREIPPISRPIPGQTKLEKRTLNSKVQKGAVFVAELEEGSTRSIPVLLRLYSNTTGVLPAPNQIVFCHPGTSLEEITLLLQRCIGHGAPTHFRTDVLFALINVELLSTEIQLELVKEVQRIQKEENDFFLAMICRGGSYHHIIDQFAPSFTHCLHGYSDAEMKSCLCTGWPKVEVVTSSQPGLGKTEYIRDAASQQDLDVCTMPISGPITKEGLVQQVKAQTINSYSVLHIDAAPVSDPDLFDAFLFEVVVIGMSVSGTLMCLLPSSKVVLEVANTHQDKLRNALIICSSFTRTHLEWTGCSHFIVSQDINSQVQVVCHYLKALNNGTLDTKDIVLHGQTPVSPLTTAECRTLLTNLCGLINHLSYTTLNTFLVIFAQELRRMSASLYFTTRSLKDMLGNDSNDVRSKFVEALLDISNEFTARSVKNHATEKQSGATSLLDYRSRSEVSADQMVARMKGMVKWTDSNHLLVVFHRQDSQTISPIYRLLNKVPTNITKLFETQMKRKLQNYNDMSQDQLHNILEKVCRSTRSPFQKEKLNELQSNYALTPDNLLKMILIHMRVKSHVPVIVMGETGCGKTTLITYLARVCEVSFEILNLHAGISEQDIIDFVTSLQVQAEQNIKKEVWAFLDEINTCDHLGLLNEVICHHSVNGMALPNNLIFLAACNPYCLRTGATESVGIVGKRHHDEMNKLVYRVHPLPETMMDYVWDYGSLNKNDEEAYIRRMLEAKHGTFIDLVVMSQYFMREVEKTSYCVSLRDVNRCQYLARWFEEMLKKKEVADIGENSKCYNNAYIRSRVLALAHCYHSRLAKVEDRQKYRQNVATIIAKSKPNWDIKEYHIERMIKEEQHDFLARMQLPEGTAENEALRENVFVILVSILNRIPVFVVGKPGCSKSLSMQLIRSNLRGPDSKDTYFKGLSPVYVVSYQGSESSTSDGIIKIFDKAKNYKKHKQDVMPVVLLDEIGLAERSRFNPLKVLHSQLEPTVGGFPPVAVVGISNWSLDAAKMNRAIHLSRPEPTIQDLADTAKSIRNDTALKRRRSLAHHIIIDDKLQSLAKAYSDYQVKQKHANFHGLRDYYSLVKYVATQSSEYIPGDPSKIIEKGILRNFGGLNLEMCRIMNTFTAEMGLVQQPDTRPKTMQLIQENLDDRYARHLMLITSGDSALNILEQTLHDREHLTKFGSRFDNDISEEYNYTILSEIILCMERGVTLVLRDLESIYGSLYDMLNQNYTIVGKKRNCRVALGPFSNPMCEVHQDFRCIVLVDEQKVDYQNPPFLNRFEKQTLRFSDIILDAQVETIRCLRRWMDDICCVEGFQFTEEAMFLGFHSDTLPSLVYYRSRNLPSDITPHELAERCQNDLLKVACPDAVLRASKSKLAKKNRAVVDRFQKTYFSLPLQGGIRHFFDEYLNILPDAPHDYRKTSEEEIIPIPMRCTRTVLYTHSSIHTDVGQLLDSTVTVQVEKLSKFKSERQFNAQMRHFWFETTAELLVLQCMTSHDAAHMLLAKTRIDQYRKEYEKNMETSPAIKHVCILVHIDRGDKDDVDMYPWQFNFLCGWNQFTVDNLEPNHPPLDDLLQGSVSDHLAGIVDLEAIIKEQLLWCFSCIKYENQSRKVDSALQLAGEIAKSKEFLSCLKMQILNFIRESERNTEDMSLELYSGWQVEVATTIDLLYRCSTLTGALAEHIKQCVREPLAKIIILLENLCAWSGSACICIVSEDTAEFWQACFNNPNVFDINRKDLPQPRGPESCLVDCNFVELKYPFFKAFHKKIEIHKDWLMHQDSFSACDDQANTTRHVCNQLTDIINHMSEIQYEDYLEKHIHDYLDDMYNTFSAKYAPHMPSHIRLDVMKWLMVQVMPPENTEVGISHQLALNYVIIWSNAELLAAELQLIVIYSDVAMVEPSRLLEEIQQILNGILYHIVEDQVHLDYCEDGSVGLNSSNKYSEESFIEKKACESWVKDEDVKEFTEKDADAIFNSDHDRSCDNQCDSGNGNVVDIVNSIGNAEETFGIVEVLQEPIKKPLQMSVNLPDEPAETILVTEVCRAMLPVRQVIETSGGLEQWQRKASSVLLLAGQIRGARDSAVLHFLRLCRDFVAVLAHDFNITEDQITALCDLGKHAHDPLESEDVFMFITSTVAYLKHQEEVEDLSLKLDHFITTYYGICLKANLDTPLIPEIVKALCTDSNLLLHGSRPVLLDIFKSDIEGDDMNNSVPVCEKLIISGELDDDVFPNLASVDYILQENELDSNLSAACCDIIEDIAFKHITCDKIAGVTSEDDQIWKIASCAVRVLENQEQVKSSLQFVTAAAFMRSLIKSTAELIEGSDTKQFKLNGDYFVLANILNGLLVFEEDARCKTNVSLIQVFLLKCLRENRSLCELRELCVELTDPITNLGNVKWQNCLFTTRLGYCPMGYVDHYNDAIDALSAWQVQQDKSKMINFIATARSSPAYRLSLLAAAANTFYFVQTTEGLKDVDKQEAQWLYDATNEFHDVYRQFFKRILGLSDFTGVLHLSESSSKESIEISSVVVHLTSIVVSHAENDGKTDKAFLSFINQSTPINQMVLPCTGEPLSVVKTPYTKRLLFFDCLCGLRIVGIKDEHLTSNCPTCHRKKSGKSSVYLTATEESSRSAQIGYNRPVRQTQTTTESVPGLSPVSYRVLDIFLHSCFLAGVCVGFVTKDKMALLLSLPECTAESPLVCQDEASSCEDITPEMSQLSSPAFTTDRDIHNYLTTILEGNWRLLRDITQTSHEGVTVLIHRLIRACTNEIVTQSVSKSAEDRFALESDFSEIIDMEAQNIPQCQIRHKQECLQSESIIGECLEFKLEESDSVQIHQFQELDDKEHNLQLRRLFRRKHNVSFQHFQSRFANTHQTNKYNFPFLQLFLSRLNALQYIRYLPNLLKWNTLVNGRLNHIIKRDEAKRIKVGEFLSDRRYHPSDTSMTAAKTAFSSFQKAWNHVRGGWYILTGSAPKFSTMTAANYITQCIVDKNEQDCYLRQMINTLKEVQNRFLMDTLAIVTYGYCPALNFLIMNSDDRATLPTLSLQAAEDAIIQYEWSDTLLVFHDIDTEYGKGVVINYKFTIIERELARILVLNKAILREGTMFIKFTYSDELFHACSVILSEIGTTVLQQKLPKEVVNTIMREQDRHQTFANDLLDHLEVILVLLKKTGGDPCSTLDEYIQRWSTLLPSSFQINLLPEPKDGVKLQNVVHLYETLEDLLVGVVESLHDDFRKELPQRSIDVLAQKLKPLSIEKLEECAAMVRRFVFRYLRSDTKTNNSDSLKEVMVRSTGGTIHCSAFIDLLPDYLEVGHVVKILEFIEKQQEQRSDALHKRDRPQNRSRAVGGKVPRKRHGGIGGLV